MITPTSPDRSVPEIDLDESLVALLVHLLWRDARCWDPKRKLKPEDALNLADQLAAHLPAHRREQLEEMREPQVASGPSPAGRLTLARG